MPNFADLVDMALVPGSEGLRPVIEKEILHYDIIFALDQEGFLNDLTFQGGTSLRLCYGSSRFSEDLDFVGGCDFTSDKLAKIHDCVMDHIGIRYGLEVNVKTPKQMRAEKTYWGLKTDRWQIAVTTHPGRADLPQQRIKLEVANVPAHTKVLRSLDRNYSFLPASYQDILVPVETLNEIMADKVVALSACQSYIRHRDIWDLMWLKKNKAMLDPELVAKKVEDYQSEDFENALGRMCGKVQDIALSKVFYDEMLRFIDPEARKGSLDKPGFLNFIGTGVSEILSEAYTALYDTAPEEEFTM